MCSKLRVIPIVVMLLLTLAFVPTSHAALQAVGPADPATCAPPVTQPCGFPAWYQDTTGISLTQCFDVNGFCPVTTAAFPNPGLPFGPNNFPDEGFYFIAGANAGTFLYEAALEFAYGSLVPTSGQELTFARTRVIQPAAPVGTYTVTHPYGVDTMTSDLDAQGRVTGVKFTNDLGLGGPPFTAVLTAPNMGPFLHCAGGPGCVGGVVTGPAGEVYLGNGVTPVPVTGTVVTNVTVAGPLTGDALGLFTVEGKVIGMSVTPSSIAFPAQRPSPFLSAPVVVTVTNLSTLNAVAVGQIISQGANAADFTIPVANDTCSNTTIPARTTPTTGICTFNVVFNGAAVGPAARTGTILIPSAVAASPPVFITPVTGIIDAVPPTVASTFPTAPTAPANVNVTVTFSEAMLASTITNTSITLRSNGAVITGLPALVYSDANNTASIALASTPAQEQALIGTVISVQTSTFMTDVVGNPLASAVTFTFTAAEPDRVPPTLASITPANNATGVRTNEPITVAFSEPMLATSITGSTIRLTSGGVAVSGTVTVNGAVASFTPAQPLAFGTAYTLTISPGALDVASNALTLTQNQVINFVTNFQPVAAEIVSPANGATTARPVILRWKPSVDQDGDTVQYHLFLCNNQNFVGTPPNCIQNQAITPVAAQAKGVYYASVAGGSMLFSLFGLGWAFGFKGRKRILMLIAVLVISGLFIVSCSSDSEDSPPPAPTDLTFQVDGLNANATYFWKIEADDNKGGVTATPVMTFTTQ